MYWTKKTKIRVGPHMWVVMSRPQWLSETNLSLDQYKRGLSSLVSAGLVISTKHVRSGVTVAHLRLSEKAVGRLEAPYFDPLGEPDLGVSVGADSHQPLVQQCTNGGCTSAPTYISKEIKKGDKEVSSEPPLAEQIGDAEKGAEMVKPVGKTIAEIMASAEASKASANWGYAILSRSD